jgi:hypothetical protein
MTVKSRTPIPPTPTKKRNRMNLVYEHLCRWDEEGCGHLEQLSLLALFKDDPKSQAAVRAGKLTARMRAHLLLGRLGFLDYMARSEPDDLTMFSRIQTVMMGRASRRLCEDEQDLAERLNAIEHEMTSRELYEIPAAYDDARNAHPILFAEIEREARLSITSRQVTQTVTGSYNLGDRADYAKQANAFRKQLGHKFIWGTHQYQEQKIHEWRSKAKKKAASAST